jgi:hypothetical protein
MSQLHLAGGALGITTHTGVSDATHQAMPNRRPQPCAPLAAPQPSIQLS